MADNELNPVLGIDLGTTFSAIARWHENRREPRHYQHSQSGDTLQSVVYCDPETSEILVGKLAYKKGFMYPQNVAVGVKRMMDDASQIISIGGQNFSPIDLSAKILRELYQDITKQFGSGKFKSRGTVVAVPYYFKAHQCEHTRKAAAIADINCLGLIQEPIAASLAYAWQLVQDRPDEEIKENILVFDLGGGTFDLALFCLHQTPTKLLFEVLATGGDDRLGGMDFDECLYNLILKKGDVSLAGLSDIEQKKARQKIIEQATEAKITLSAALDTYVTATDVIAGKHIDIKVTRAEFEKSIEVYIKQIDQIIQKVWTISNLRPSDIDRVILVGGSSRIPCVRSLICNLIGEEKVYANINSSLCVAEGAAIYAAYLDDRAIFGRDIEIKDFSETEPSVEKSTFLEYVLTFEQVRQVFEWIISTQKNFRIELNSLFQNNAQLDIKMSKILEENAKIYLNLTELTEKQNLEIIWLNERLAKLEESAKFKFDTLVKDALKQDYAVWDEDSEECQKYIEQAKFWHSKTEALYTSVLTAISDCGDRIDKCGDLMQEINKESSTLHSTLLDRYRSLELSKRMLERLREPIELLKKSTLPSEQLLRLEQQDLVDLLRWQNDETEAKKILAQKVKETGDTRYKAIREWRDWAEKSQKQWLNFIEKKLLFALDGINDGKPYAEHLVAELINSYKIPSCQQKLSDWLQTYFDLENILLESLKNLDITQILVVRGQPVDFDRHEPIGTEADPYLPHESIKEVTRIGYEYKLPDQEQPLIARIAQVIVVKNK